MPRCGSLASHLSDQRALPLEYWPDEHFPNSGMEQARWVMLVTFKSGRPKPFFPYAGPSGNSLIFPGSSRLVIEA